MPRLGRARLGTPVLLSERFAGDGVQLTYTVRWHLVQLQENLKVLSMIPDVQLSKREIEVLELVLQGNSNKQIALSLHITVRTVEFHLKNIYAKFQVSSRIELILKLGHATHLSRTQVPGQVAKIEELWSSTVDRRGKTPKMEAGSIHKWIGLHLEMLSLSSVRS